MKKNQLYRKFLKLRKHAEKGQYILKVSKALFKSMNMAPVSLPASIFLSIESTKIVAATSVLRLRRKPN